MIGVFAGMGCFLLLNGAAILASETKEVQAENPPDNMRIKSNDVEPYYLNVLETWQQQNIKYSAASIRINAADKVKSSDDSNIAAGSYNGKNNVLLWKGNGNGWVEFQFTAPEDGLYEISTSYCPITGTGFRSAIIWDVTIDGSRQFRESSSITLCRLWKDARPIKKDDEGDDIRPQSLEISSWNTTPFRDSGGAYSEPLKWYITKGTHTLRLAGSEPVALETVNIAPPERLSTYKEAAASYPETEPVKAEALTIQAEDFQSKNSSAIQMVSDTDIRSVPVSKGNITFNTLGGQKWRYQNQEVTWEFDIPQTGKYKIAMRTLQNIVSEKASYRTIKIDGKVPFQEFLEYRFPYSSDWEGTVLKDPEGQAYELYLEKGRHTLSMAVTHAPFKTIIVGIEDLLSSLNRIDQDLRALTGGREDKNRTWNIKEELPDLTDQLKLAENSMLELSKQIIKANGRPDSISQSFKVRAVDIEELLEKVNDIPYHRDQISIMADEISQYITILEQQQLQLDEIHIVPAEQDFSKMKASFLEKVRGTILNFFYSFQSKDSLRNMDDKVLNVWVFRGKDYVDEIQELANEQFTPQTGTKVKVNLLPNTQLLVLSNAAGVQPDIALGLTQDLPIDYAIRNSTYDLSKFDDFQDIYKKYSPGSWLPFYYNKGYYAVPETQSFQVLYYRKDILGGLGLSIPQTWEEVYDLLPVLQQNYMNFYVNPKAYIPYFYQNNAAFYDESGLKTALDTPEAFKAFKQWTDLFNIHALELEVPSFYQHFRDGTMPIGISDYNMYIRLAATAPELHGRWGIALIPGTKQEDGTITRWAGGGQTAGIIFKSSHKKEQAWDFMKWWISADVQEQYGSNIEAFNGIAFRWNTANIEAFVKLPWAKEDADVILEQWRWYRDLPNLPGGYRLDIEINNAWNRTVVDRINYRSSLEAAVIDINRELRRKQQEFGFIDKDGKPLKTLKLPTVLKPWEGVDDYVK
ncbi:bacterial extracellular solute-binding protein [Ruminiclostridium hungatei]|uniref:Bacterial extracellular solute-binding protein n=1 Tax=Ruminiclostridium hungatei TaxID=48256 RepID=A0A1V4SM56_RUMHU|nr:extracellular solute-binding protein [Ruminiclostridium hungatei]OPX44972.1 bacterial extracellular solute-binding protein [Ruminiclostridium hungatei]